MQCTLKKQLTIKGRGLHTGRFSTLTIFPAKENRGIRFNKIKLSRFSVDNTMYAIDLKYNGMKIRSVEHLLACLYGVGIDNCNIEIDGEEIPALDGSAYVFLRKIKGAGIKKLKARKKSATLKKPFAVSLNNRHIIAFPADSLTLTIAVQYDNTLINRQLREFKVNPEIFQKEIAPAKTFTFSDQIKTQKKAGMIKGGNLTNALVFNKHKLVNPNIQRFKDEVVRHKALDFLGALALIETDLKAHIIAVKSGHTIDVHFVEKLNKEIKYGK